MKKIVDEFLQTVIIGGLMLIFYFTCVVPWFDVFSYPRGLMMTELLSIVGFFQILILTLMPIARLQKRLKTMNPNSLNSADKSLLSIHVPVLTNIQSYSKDPSLKNPLKLSEILSHKLGFELFTNHLVLEFSVENMLFLLEIDIIKDEIIKNKFRCVSFLNHEYIYVQSVQKYKQKTKTKTKCNTKVTINVIHIRYPQCSPKIGKNWAKNSGIFLSLFLNYSTVYFIAFVFFTGCIKTLDVF